MRVEARTLASAACVSRRWRQLAREERLWEAACVREWANTGLREQILCTVLLSASSVGRLGQVPSAAAPPSPAAWRRSATPPGLHCSPRLPHPAQLHQLQRGLSIRVGDRPSTCSWLKRPPTATAPFLAVDFHGNVAHGSSEEAASSGRGSRFRRGGGPLHGRPPGPPPRLPANRSGMLLSSGLEWA
ncbi:hypothetical protein BS78_02G126000 [Paspalum vaginatum]|nr:hypothetical protein BS78_02G126000 [Paspalum vaginatum]